MPSIAPLRDGEEATVLAGLSAAVGAVVVLLADAPEPVEPVGVLAVGGTVFACLVFALAVART